MPLAFRRAPTLLGAFVFLLAAPGPARAHDYDFTCTVKGLRVEFAGYSDDNLPAKEGKVTVTEASSKRIVAEGKTDAAGKWSFARPTGGRYTVRLDPEPGHLKERVLVVRPWRLVDTGLGGSAIQDLEGAAGGLEDGVSRDQFTGFPWLKLAVGLAAIAGLAIAALVAVRCRRTPKTQGP